MSAGFDEGLCIVVYDAWQISTWTGVKVKAEGREEGGYLGKRGMWKILTAIKLRVNQLKREDTEAQETLLWAGLPPIFSDGEEKKSMNEKEIDGIQLRRQKTR